MKKQYEEQAEKKRLKKKSIIAIVLIIFMIGVIAGIFKIADSRTVGVQSTDTEKDESIIYKGETYVPKKNISTYLIAGIDSSDKIKKLKEYDGTGQCDTLALVVQDRSTDTCKTLTIDRNTMTNVKSLSDKGEYLATTKIQLSLAHAMSLDHKKRAENTVDAVSNLFDGQKIDGYAMVNMGAIVPVNDMVGGVIVKITDEFPGSKTLIKGKTVTLKGNDAETFVRERKDVGDGLNDNRMKRQQVYEVAFKQAFYKKCNENKKFPLEVYNTLQDYMTTNITAQQFSKLAVLMASAKADTKLTVKGKEGFDDDGWQTFTPDKDSLKQVELELFYKKQK